MRGNTEASRSRCKKSRRKTGSSNDSVVSINDLPENVLIHIMSLLPIKDAVRTSVLSKEWEYKWALLYHIEIDDWQSRCTNELSFLNFVDRILLHSLNIQSFHLSRFHHQDPYRLKIWISHLLRRNVPRIKIFSSKCGGFTLPHCVFDNTSLTSLDLHLPCIVKFPDKGYFCNVKLLVLESVHFQNERISNTGQLQLTFPVLESLDLQSCKWGNVKFVEISSPTLTTFTYMCSEVLGNDSRVANDSLSANDFVIKICGSKLEKFQICGVSLNNFDLSASSVVDAQIFNANQSEHPFARVSGSCSQLSIEIFSGLKCLRLLGQITKVYGQFKSELPLPRFDRLQTLELSICSSIEGFLELLHMAPVLQQLIINTRLQWGEPDDSKLFNFDEVGSVPSCMLSHLAEIKIFQFFGTTHELHLVKFLLKNSVKLEKVVVAVRLKSRTLTANIEKMLSTYPKGSPCISMVFTQERI